MEPDLEAAGLADPRATARRAALLRESRDDILAPGDVGVLPRDYPFILGAEITQAIQYFRSALHLSDPADRGPDNGVPLVAYKPAWVRVYVRSGPFSAGTKVTGYASLERLMGPFPGTWRQVPGLNPVEPGQVTTVYRPGYTLERATAQSTINFVVPAAVVAGRLRLRIRIWQADDPDMVAVDMLSIGAAAFYTQTLRVRGVFISYNGPPRLNPPAGTPNLNLPAAPFGALQATAALAMTTFPVASTAEFSHAGTMRWGTPLTGTATSPGGCSQQWLALNAAVAAVKANDGNRSDVIYYGLLPAGTPISNVGGCESSGVSTGPVGAQATMAHEIGHAAGLRHAPCGTTGKLDLSYPAYEPYDPPATPTASIGEYGLDINTGLVYDPDTKDYMSYCQQAATWISLYNHSRLWNNERLHPRKLWVEGHEPDQQRFEPFRWPQEYQREQPVWRQSVAGPPPRAVPVISLVGMVDDDMTVHVTSVMRVTALPVLTGAPTELIAELAGKDGTVLASAGVVQLQAQAMGCGCQASVDGDGTPGPFAFQALLDDVGPGAVLRIRRRGATPAEPGTKDGEPELLWQRQAPAQPPELRDVTATAGGGRIRLRWALAGGQAPVSCSVQMSIDGGASWNGVSVGVDGTAEDVAFDRLPAGEAVFRILAHDGFHTVAAVAKPVLIPPHPPAIAILHPVDGRPVLAGRPLRLHGAVTSWHRQSGEDATVQATWYIDGKPVAEDLDTFVPTPGPGEYQLRLSVRDPGGQATYETLLIVTAGQGPLPEPPVAADPD